MKGVPPDTEAEIPSTNLWQPSSGLDGLVDAPAADALDQPSINWQPTG